MLRFDSDWRLCSKIQREELLRRCLYPKCWLNYKVQGLFIKNHLAPLLQMVHQHQWRFASIHRLRNVSKNAAENQNLILPLVCQQKPTLFVLCLRWRYAYDWWCCCDSRNGLLTLLLSWRCTQGLMNGRKKQTNTWFIYLNYAFNKGINHVRNFDDGEAC